MYFNTQEEIITKLAKSLEKSLILRKKAIKILISNFDKLFKNIMIAWDKFKKDIKLEQLLWLFIGNEEKLKRIGKNNKEIEKLIK